MVPAGGAGQYPISNSTVDVKKRSKTQSSQCHPEPHLCGGREGFQANGLTHVGLSSFPAVIRNGSFGNTEHLR